MYDKVKRTSNPDYPNKLQIGNPWTGQNEDSQENLGAKDFEKF